MGGYYVNFNVVIKITQMLDKCIIYYMPKKEKLNNNVLLICK